VIGFDELVERFAGLDRGELARWVENRWILPERNGEMWLFREVDIARVELILDIRREFTIEDDAVSLLLGLLDQVYSLRRQMRRLCDAVERQPPEIREAIRRALPPVAGKRNTRSRSRGSDGGRIPRPRRS
jgi:chaperone modulatory protein CbpM